MQPPACTGKINAERVIKPLSENSVQYELYRYVKHGDFMTHFSVKGPCTPHVKI